MEIKKKTTCKNDQESWVESKKALNKEENRGTERVE